MSIRDRETPFFDLDFPKEEKKLDYIMVTNGRKNGKTKIAKALNSVFGREGEEPLSMQAHRDLEELGRQLVKGFEDGGDSNA